jgi:uncharacterized repeat protein (TIGR01451 family)
VASAEFLSSQALRPTYFPPFFFRFCNRYIRAFPACPGWKSVRRFTAAETRVPNKKTPRSIKRRFTGGLVAGVLGLMFSSLLSAAPNSNFSVSVNPGPVAPNSDTVYPGQPTSLRVTFSNNHNTDALSNVSFNAPLPGDANGGLRVNGTPVISGAGCAGGSATTVVGEAGVVLSGLTVPPLQAGVANSGECYLDIPVVAWSVNGASTSHSYDLPAGSVSSDQGENSSGGPQSITVSAVPRPTWSKGFPTANGTLILGGDSGILRITVNNPNPYGSLTNFAFNDPFPLNGSGVGGAIIEPVGTAAVVSCSPAGAVNPAVDLTQGAAAGVAVSGGTLPPNGSCTIDVAVQARHSAGIYEVTGTNTMEANNFSSDEGLRPASNATRNLTVRSPLAITKSFNHAPNPIAAGVYSTFTVRLQNNGLTPLVVEHFEDNPISAAPYVGKLKVWGVGSSGCGGSTPTIVPGSDGFTASGLTIPAGGSCGFLVNFIGETTGDDTPSAYQNVIPQGAVKILGQPDIISQSVSASVTIADRLRVLKAQTPANVAPGNPVNYTITVENFSDQPLANVAVADSLNNGATLLTGADFPASVTPACDPLALGLNLNGRVQGDADLLFSIPTVPARTDVNALGVCTISFWAMIDPASEAATLNRLEACSVYVSDPADPTVRLAPQVCNGLPVEVTNPDQAIIGLQKRFNGLPSASAFEGTPARMRLVVSSWSDNPLTAIALSDPLPIATGGIGLQQMQIASPANLTNNCGGTVDLGPTSLTLNGGSMAARVAGSNTPATCTIEVDVVGPAGEYDNTATVAAVQTNADGTPLNVNTFAEAELIYEDALTAAKSFSPAQVSSGGRSTLRIRLGNLGTTLPITGLAVTDNLPTGMVVASPSNAYATCASGVVGAPSGATTVSLSGAVIPPGASCELLVDVIATGTSDWLNSIEPGEITANNGLLNRTPVTANLAYIAAAIPTISKNINPGSIVPGHSSLLTVTITNSAQALTGVGLTDWFTLDGTPTGTPNGMEIASSPQASTTCPGGVVTAVPGQRSLSLSMAEVAPGQVCTVTARVASKRVGTISNLIPENAIVSDQGASNTSTFAQSTLSTTSTVGISKEFTPKVVHPGDISRLRISFFNPQNQAIQNFGIVDSFPAGLLVAPVPNAFSTCGGAVSLTWPGNDSVRLTGGALAAAVGDIPASCYLELDVIAVDPGSYLNSIPANTLTVDDVPVNHPPVEDTLEVRYPLLLNKAIDNKTLDLNDPVGFETGEAIRLPGVTAVLTIRVENTDNQALTQMTFTDNLPDGLVLSQAPNASWSCATGTVNVVASGRSVTLAGASVPANTACLITVNVVSNAAGIYDNVIPPGSVTTYEGVTNEEPTEARLIVTEPGMVTKQFEPPVVAPNVPSRLTITIANPNDANMILSAPLVDTLPTLPAQMLVAPAPNIATSCPGGGGIVTAAAAAVRVQINSGAVIPSGGCSVEVDVVAAEPGNYANHIAAGALQTNFGPNEEPAEAILLISTLGYISGKVFIDREPVPDGVWHSGRSTAIAGNTIELREGNSCTGDLLETTTTDASGNYLFSELPAGTYSVCQVEQPSGTLNSITTEGVINPYNGSTGTVGSASNPADGTPTSQIVGIVLNNNGNADEVSGSPQNNFSEILPARISGWVYHDRNDDGVRDGGEEGIPGVVITLTGPNGLTKTTTTAADGSWFFDELPPGEYTLTETHPSGWEDGQDTAGSKGGNATDDVISNVTLVAGDNAVNYNFGEKLPQSLALTATAMCVNNLPYVNYVVSSAEPFDSSAPLFTLSLVTEGGRLVGQPASGSLLWPGVEIDADGNVVSYPGWALVNGKWEQVSDDRRPSITLEVLMDSVQADASVTYLRSSASCAPQPSGTFTPPVAAPTTTVWGLMLLSALLMLGTWYQQRYRLRIRN